MARGAGSRGPAPNGGSKGLEGEVAGPLGGQRFLEWIVSRSTTPCSMRHRGRSTRGGACSRSRSWVRGVNRGPPGRRPTLGREAGGLPSREGGRSRARSSASRKASWGPARGRPGSARLRPHATDPLAKRPGSQAWGGFGSCPRGRPHGPKSMRTLHRGDGRGRPSKGGAVGGCAVKGTLFKSNPSVRSTRSRTSSGCSISRVGCRVRGDASLRTIGHVPSVVLRRNAGRSWKRGEARRTWRRCPGWAANRYQVTRCVAEWV